MIPKSTIKPYRVLSLDGGGIRGLYTASVLNNLSARFGENLDIGKGFDLIAGTSTGGILAACLAAGIPLSKIIDLYYKKATSIFNKPMPHNKILKLIWGMMHFQKSANGNADLAKILNEVFGDETIGQLYQRRKIGICMPSVNLITHKARVFKTANNPKKNADDNIKIVDVCLASSAAPIIFPIAGISDSQTNTAKSYFVDGGLWAHNPLVLGSSPSGPNKKTQ